MIIGKGAEAYWKNLDEVNALIRDGLSEEIKDDLEDALKVLIGFLLWRAAAAVLIRQPHPLGRGIGFAMEGMALAAGYALNLEFVGSTEERLVKAGFHLAKVVPKDENGTLDDVSKLEMKVAAGEIRPIVAQIATILIMKSGEKVAKGLKPKARKALERYTKKGERGAIECTICEIRSPRQGPTRPYENRNPKAKPEEQRLGALMDRLAQLDGLPGVRRVIGWPESPTPGVRSGDYRLQAADGSLTPADGYQPQPTTSDRNVWDVVVGKATQAVVVIVELPPGSSITDAQARASADAAANYGTRLQRVIYVGDGAVIADAVRDPATP